jgi:Tol biopolymer transport system component
MTDSIDLLAALSDRYRIERELGAGGMATVYLAQDLRHDRKVALKVLRPELAAVIGAERFLAEIKTTANLQHPHILALFDSGKAGELVFYVMPYVEGESLRDRLTREKQLPVEEALRIAREVADALEYAHHHNVIHRDIKPENILLHGGHALVADFGIALAASRSEGGARMTETGMSLGTPHYMSPEQAMGQREINARSDVYALGCVTYEMLTGEPPFNGPTPQAIVARVMTEEPRSLTLQRRTIPPHVEAAVMTALEKLPADRWGSAAEFSAALGGQVDGRTGGRSRAGPSSARPPVRPTALVFALAAIAVLAAWGWLRPRAGAIPPARFAMTLPSEIPPVALRLSPDGSTIAYVAPGGGDRLAIFTRRLDDLTAQKVEGTDGASTISFSPDGEWIAFMAGTQPRKIPRTGGVAVAIPVPPGASITQVEYLGPDRYVVTLDVGSLAVLNSDGSLREFSKPNATGNSHIADIDQILPDGWVLARMAEAPPDGPVVAIDPASGREDTLISQVVTWSGAGDGFLAWALPGGAMFAAPFDLRAKKLTGPGRPIGGSVLAILGFRPPMAAGGHALMYVPTRSRILARVDRSGQTTTLLGTDRSYHSPRVSPDGRRVALDFTDQVRDVWLLNISDSTLTRFGFDSTAHDPTWLPDGSGLLFAAFRGQSIGVFRRHFNGRPAAESLLVNGAQVSAHTVTPDGRRAVAVSFVGQQSNLIALALDGSGKVDTLAASPYNEGWPALSPDGRWLAYVSDESGRNEVYVRTFPGFTSKVQVSQDGGSEPVWARGGRELFYRSGSAAEPWLLAAAVETSGEFRVSGRTRLFNAASYEFATPHANYDVFPDGRSFVMVRQGRPGQSAEIVYLQNLPGLLKAQAK